MRHLVPPSLGGRLLAGSVVFTLVALVFALFVMWHVLDRFVTSQIDQRLDNKIVALASQAHVAPDGMIRLDGDADGPPFDKPRRRAFWWIGGPRNSLHTAWLRPADFSPPTDADLQTLPAPPPPPPGAPDEPSPVAHPQTIETAGPGGRSHVRVARRTIDGVAVTIYVATPVTSIADPMREAMTTIAIAMAALGLALFLATIAQVRLGLRPLARLRDQVAAVRAGGASDLPVTQPREILPLVVELNSLLAQNAETLARARRHVANLAHGLKTPLATLSLNVDRLDSDARPALQDLVGQVERRIRHHLGRARAAALDGPVRARTPLAARLRDLSDVLDRIYAAKAIVAAIECSDDLAVACEPQDVDEILGNLLDNAFKFARSRVVCDARIVDTMVRITIEDDGPGLKPDDMERVQRPGQRLDEAVPGFGFGLSIVRELAELYSGTLTLAALDPGLRVTLDLPRVL